MKDQRLSQGQEVKGRRRARGRDRVQPPTLLCGVSGASPELAGELPWERAAMMQMGSGHILSQHCPWERGQRRWPQLVPRGHDKWKSTVVVESGVPEVNEGVEIQRKR